MPELPEVETTLRGVEPWVVGQCVKNVVVRQPRLRWPIPDTLPQTVKGQRITGVERRAKYLLFHCNAGAVLMHLGMSGSLRLVKADDVSPEKHDHVDIVFENVTLRYRDPRRFGAILWVTGDPFQHALLKHLGPEPLGDTFDGAYLYQASRLRRMAVKSFIMNSHAVVGVGNIYASEALFMAGIRPSRAANRISKARYMRLVAAIREVLSASIEAGGTSLKDFISGEGQPGYFKQQLRVYQREGEACLQCSAPIQRCVLGQRSTFYCKACQR